MQAHHLRANDSRQVNNFFLYNTPGLTMCARALVLKQFFSFIQMNIMFHLLKDSANENVILIPK
jgi:hypothetical protein